jgi:DNA-binding SARP family transcriptional activator
LQLLGAFRLSRGNEDVEVSAGGQRILALLALGGRPISRDFVATMLWPQSSMGRGLGSLRSTLWRLPRPGGRQLVDAAKNTLRLDPSLLVDLYDVQRVARAAMVDATSYQQDRLDDSGVDALLADVLVDWWEEWVVDARERHRQLRLHALEALARGQCVAGQFGSAVDLVMRATSLEPLRESAHRCLMEVHLAEGNVTEVVRHFSVYSELCRRSGTRPSAPLRRWVGEVTNEAMAVSA